MSNGIKTAARLELQIRAVEGLCLAGVLVGGDMAVGWCSRRLGRVDSSHRRPAGI